MMWEYGYYPMHWGGAGFIFMIIFWVLIIAGIVYLIRWSFNQSGGTGGQPSARGQTPLEILKERYAKGEIDKKEFEEKKKDLV